MKKHLLLFSALLFCTLFSIAQTGNIIIPGGHSKSIKQVVLDKQGKYLYMLEDGKVIMWDAKTHDQLYTFNNGYDRMSLSNDGTKLIVGVACYSTITGKEIFKVKGDNGVFSPDDKTLYTIDGGILATDLQTQKQTRLSERIGMGYKPELYVLDDGHLLIIGVYDGWVIFNLASNTIDFQSNFGGLYMPNLHCVAVSSKKVEMKFLDVYNGKLLKSFPATEGDQVLIPSVDDNTFIYCMGGYSNRTYQLINGQNWSILKQFKPDFDISCGYFSGKENLLYCRQLFNTKTGVAENPFKGQTADLGEEGFNPFEYNYASGVVNMITNQTVYKSIDMVKLKPFRHIPIPDLNMIAFSPTGDTTAVFNYSKPSFYIKNIVTGKTLLPAVNLIDEASGTERDNFFFNKNGSHVYYPTFNIKKQQNTLNRINVSTGSIEHIFSYRGTLQPYLHPDKDLLAAFESGYQFTHAKVWDVRTGKILFDKDVDKSNNHYITISDDKKQVLIVRDKAPFIYDLASGNLLSQGKVTIFNDDAFGSTPDLSLIVHGSIYGDLVAINTAGEVVYNVKAHMGSIRRIIFSKDGKLMFTISEDQTIKVWRPQTGKLLGTLFLYNDGNDYVFLDAYGRFDGSSGGMKRMYYFRDRIKITLDVVYEKFYTPNLYQRLVNGEVFEPIDIIINPQPKVRISYATVTRNLNVVDDGTPTYQNTTGAAEITVNASAENDKVEEIRLFHNGKIVNLATRGLFVTDNAFGNETKKYTLNLLPGMNSIRAVALNSQRTESEPDEIAVNYGNGSSQPNVPAPNNSNVTATISPVDKNATLHLIVVGINKYQNEKMSLNYALADATAFKDEAEKDALTMVTNLKTYFVTDEKADKNGITAAFAEVQKNAKPQDVFVFYYAGHGVISENSKEFYLVPNDVTDLKNVDEALQKHGIASKILQEYAINIQAQKQLFILDACQSAGAFEAMLASDGNQQKSLAVVSRSTGTHWIAASGSQQFANEFSQLGHGAFTYVLLQGMKGEAAANKMITVNGLKNFLQTGVPALMKKYNGSAQLPASYGLGNDFPVEVIR